MDAARPFVEALAARDGRVLATGTAQEVLRHRGPQTRLIELSGRTAIPGLNDSHIHLIRGGLHYNLELRWDGVPSLAEALERLRVQAKNTPPPQWVRVVGGWTEFQFAEGRMPTLDELNAAAPDTPVFILHLYDQALLNRAALRALGYDADAARPSRRRDRARRERTTHRPADREAERADPLLDAGRAPKLSHEDQANSTRHFMRELNRLGVTSVIDAGGGFQNYPDDYAVIRELRARGSSRVRIAYNLFAQKAGEELADYQRWTGMTRPGDGDDYLRMTGRGREPLLVAPPTSRTSSSRGRSSSPRWRAQLEPIVRLLAEKRWPFRIHATYDESICALPRRLRARQSRTCRSTGLHWFIDHAETISDRNIERIARAGRRHRDPAPDGLPGRVLHRSATERLPRSARRRSGACSSWACRSAPAPMRTRVASYNPWVCLGWLVTGRTRRRNPALRRRRTGSSATRRCACGRAAAPGSRARRTRRERSSPGQLADLAVLSKDFFSVPEDEIQTIESVLTIVGGKVVFAAEPVRRALAPAAAREPGMVAGGALRRRARRSDAVSGVSEPPMRIPGQPGDPLACACFFG